MATVLIAGAGYVGSALATRLGAAGHRVIAVRRGGGAPGPGVEWLAIDLTDPAALADIPEGIERVVYAASPGGGGDDRAYARAYVEGPTRLVDLLARRGDPVARLILTSSSGVHAQADGAWVDEDSPAEPTHGSALRMCEGEDVVLASPFSSVVIRFGGIYGPGRTHLLERVRTGEARTPRLPLWTNRIHRDDCAGALAHLLFHESPEPLYLGVDREPVELGALLRWLAERLGVAPPVEAESGSSPTGRRARSNKRCRGDRLIASGYALRFPTYREGYGALIADR